MVDGHSIDGASESVLSKQGKVDVLRDELKNLFYSRLIVYFVVAEIVLVVSGYGLDYLAGPYSESTNSIHVMASILGVFAFYIALFFVLFLCIGLFFTVVRTIRSDM